MTGTNLTIATPTLPGLLPDVEIATTIKSFTTWREGSAVIINREPSMVERELLGKRLRILDVTMAPFWTSPEIFDVVEPDGSKTKLNARQLIKRALSAFFIGYPSTQHADGPGLVTAYMADLQKMPVFSLLQAFDDIKHGRVTVKDKWGRDLPLDKDWPPSSIRVYDAAVKAMTDLNTEHFSIQRILGPTKLAKPEMSEDERKVVAVNIQRMHEEFKKRVIDDHAPTPAQKAEADKRERDRAAARQAHDNELILAEYRRQGIEPVYAGDMLVSPELARKNSPARFAGR